MSDMIICINNDCGLIDFCWRFNAPTKIKDEKYELFIPDYDENKCKFFLDFPGQNTDN